MRFQQASTAGIRLALLAGFFSQVPLHAGLFTFTVFDVPGALRTYAHGINNQGTVVGYYEDAQHFHAFLRDTSGTLTFIDFPGSISSAAYGINDVGVVSGLRRDGIGTSGFIRAVSGSYAAFNVPGESQAGTEGFGINNNSEIITYSQNLGGYSKVRSADGSSYTDTPIPVANFTVGWGINDAGQTVGGAVGGAIGPPGTLPYLMQSDHTQYSLLLVPGAVDGALARDINNLETIVGYYDNNTGGYGFLRHSDGSYDILQVPGGANTEINGINDDGWIVGSFADANGVHGFIGAPVSESSAVPEPCNVALLIGGLGMLGLVSRRARQVATVLFIRKGVLGPRG